MSRRTPWVVPVAVMAGVAVAGGLLGLGWRGLAALSGSLGALVGLGDLLDAARRQVGRRWR